MIIKKLAIRNFGKIHDRTLELSPGINVLYGENESGKTTVHMFLKSMLYGMQRQRGKAARTDAYATYLPWENPAVYGGTLWFENGGRQFRLTRNFYKSAGAQELFCEDDGELLDVEKGDLDAVLGGISEAVYENTVSVAQLKSVTGQGLVHELQNYMVSYQGTGDSSVDLGRTMQMLKMSRKGYQVQVERQRKDAAREQEKLTANMVYLREELGKLIERREQVTARSGSLGMSGGGDGGALLDERIGTVKKKKLLCGALMAVSLLAAGLGIVLPGHFLESPIFFQAAAGAFGILAAAFGGLRQRQLSGELQKRKRLKQRWIRQQEKLQWSVENLNEAYREKNLAFLNLKAEYEAEEQRKYEPLAEEQEVQALNLAMETIERVSGNINRTVGEGLRRRTSQILSEITSGKYREVLMDESFRMRVNTDDRTVPLESLSRGTLEQIYFALRMAAGELLCGEERFPVILDDVFGMYDEERLAAVLHWLHKEKRQIIISTCHKREMEILEREGLSYQKVFL